MSTFCFNHAEKLLSSCDARAHAAVSLETGDESLLVRAHLIRNATHTIDVQTFIWANDESGRFIVFELLKAARRGVKIRVLVDGWVIIGNPQLLTFLGTAHENITVKHYNPPAERIRPSTLDLVTMAITDFSVINHRMHNKAFVADGKAAIVGGRNYQNDYFDRSAGRNFRDREILVFGPSVPDVTEAFDIFWESERAVKGDLLKDFAEHLADNRYGSDESFELGTIFDKLNEQANDPQQMKEYFLEKIVVVKDVCFVTDLPQHYEEEYNPTVQAMVEFFAEARRNLLLQTPYLVLDQLHFETIKRLRDTHPGFRLRVSTNSLASTDNVIAYAHSARERASYLSELSMEIFEIKPIPKDVKRIMGFHRSLDALPPAAFARALEATEDGGTPFSLCCHAKTFVRDGEAVWIGSSNIDPRSARVNSENAFIIYDKDFARRVAREIERDIAPCNSWTMGLAPEDSTVAMNFELNRGGTILPFNHAAFYDHYVSVGPFPSVHGTGPEIQVRLISLLPEGTKVFV